MRAKISLSVVAAVVLLTAVVAVVGCGGGGGSNVNGTAVLGAALGDFDMSAGAVTTALSAGTDGTVAAELKTAEKDMSGKWGKVLAAARSMGWADADSGQEAWGNVQKAIDSLPANATVAQAKAAVSSPMDGLMEMEAELQSLVQSTK